MTAFMLAGGQVVAITSRTRTLFLARHEPGDLMAAGTDAAGPWVAFARHEQGSSPDCFRASGVVFDDGDAVVFNNLRFPKADPFTNPFPSTKRGQRYPVGDPCFSRTFEVVRVGYP